MRFLTRDATQPELLRACVDNHVEWLRQIAVAGGGKIVAEAGLIRAVTSQPAREVTVAVTDPGGADLRARVHDIVEDCRTSDVDLLSFWAMSEPYDARLGSWLAARGLRQGGRPRWMLLDLAGVEPPPTRAELDAAVTMSVPDRFDDWSVPELLCYHPDSWRIRQAMIQTQPRRVWHVVMWQEGRPIGQVSICASGNDEGGGVVGLHDLLIVPASRTPGPGLDRIAWLLRFLLDLGCRYVVANAAAESAALYRMFGFRPLGFGQTWWAARHLLASRPSAQQIALAEAIGEGNLDDLATMRPGTDLLNRPLANGMTPLRLAADAGQAGVARWLVTHGAEPDLLWFWVLGWHDEARQLLHRDPQLVHARRPSSGKKLLHVAVERDDPALAETLLHAGADPAARDDRFHATPLDWAVELRRPRIAALLRRWEAR
ncbi:hypothetical protein C1I95_11725 [Micromonospora craterilacus]|uniref:N-acetyltransferase domain-containing protein n=1 Tax=Micromonospora craterilacus TaxID=1655439 RepID=A0A2W2F0G6_9ACTN|nr:ankyrin repeat domain-containing protein [Micromonospora craterilacus]PZG19360.1 hypothetical protein C1I95_11725 [Micromonospora craterilacus]